MAKDGLTTRPWYRWCPRDFMCDHAVAAMTREQRMTYRESLDFSWMSDTPGVEYEEQWRRWLGVDHHEWDRVRDTFAAAFAVFGEVWVQRHLLAEFDLSTSVSRARAIAGRKGQQVLSNSSANAEQMPSTSPAVALRVESREVENLKPKPLSAGADLYRDWAQFFHDHVWPARPRAGAPGPRASESKRVAERAWLKRFPKGKSREVVIAMANGILDELERDSAAMRAEGRDASKCPHLATWLNQERDGLTEQRHASGTDPSSPDLGLEAVPGRVG